MGATVVDVARSAEGDVRPDLTDEFTTAMAGIRYEDLPPEVVRTVKNCVLDWIAVTTFGASEPASEILRGELTRLGQLGSGPGVATLVGRSERAGAVDAALINGTASHALDYDDTHPDMMGHPSAPVVAASLALGEAQNSSGTALIEAIVAGIETACRLGLVVNPLHYDSGWHCTATLGTFGATAAGAHLLDAEPAAWHHAFSLAATQAAGLKAVFGSMAKPLHAGKAASSGVLAASLGAGGFTSHETALEAPLGFADIASPGWVERSDDKTSFEGFLTPRTLFKYHAACFLTHGTIEAVKAIVGESALAADDVDSITVQVAAPVLNVCNIGDATTGLEAKFSLATMAAMSVLDDPTEDPEAYTDRRAQSREIADLRDRVTVEGAPRADMFLTQVVLVDRAGERHEREVDTSIAAADKEGEAQRLREKFRALTSGRLESERVEGLIRAIDDLENTGVADLLALTTTNGA